MGSLAETDARFRFLAASYPYGTPARVAERPARFRVHELSLTFGAPSVSRSEDAPTLMTAFLTNATEGQWNSVRAMAWSHIGICAPDACGRLGGTFKGLCVATPQLRPNAFWRLVAGAAFGPLRSRPLKTTRIGPLA
jgi:hypothetical protein